MDDSKFLDSKSNCFGWCKSGNYLKEAYCSCRCASWGKVGWSNSITHGLLENSKPIKKEKDMHYPSIRKALNLSETVYTDEDIYEIAVDAKSKLRHPEIESLLTKYELVRRIGDTEQMKYYLKRIEGILGL